MLRAKTNYRGKFIPNRRECFGVQERWKRRGDFALICCMAGNRVWIMGILLGLLSLSAGGKELYNVEVSLTVSGMKEGEKALVAYYYGEKQYIKDSVYADALGRSVFKADTANAGIYMLVFPDLDNQYLEFILNEPRFSLSTDKNDLVNSMSVFMSAENTLFFDYLKFANEQRSESEKWRKRADLTEEERNNGLMAFNDRVNKRRSDLIEQHGQMLVAKLFKASTAVTIPDAPAHLSEKEAKSFRLYYYRKHFFDHLDFGSDLLLYSPILFQKINTYLERLTVNTPDSTIVAVDRILTLCKGHPEVLKCAVVTLLNKYANSKAVCFDKVYVHIANNYYGGGKSPWASAETIKKIQERVKVLEPLCCGEKAPHFTLPNAEGVEVNLGKLPRKPTVLLFWRHDCGHCTDVLPELKALKEDDAYDFNLLAISTSSNRDEWVEKVEEYGVGSWYHVSNHQRLVDFSTLYDISSTPVIYLLDQDQKIVAKRISVENLESILGRMGD